MARDPSLKKVLIVGSGPIVIGQACEFDYSGTQACKALMREGLEVILVNSNPATIMTDPEISTRVYIEPLTVQYLEKIIEIEKPDALIPTLGGQTALNLSLALHDQGVLNKFGVKLIGANPAVIRAAEDREKFREILDEVGAKYPKSYLVRSFEEGLSVVQELGYPIILRPNYTLGGGGGGIAYTPEDYTRMLGLALHESPTTEVLVEASILGWKEYELEVMRDKTGAFVIICSIENLDPCGVHTGDSITVAPQQTLSDYEYQAMRDEAYAIVNRVGVETGGANIQFAVHPETRERVVIEMNPRVSRSSALASKATGFPIAKIAALLSVGYTLDEIRNDVTKTTPASFEPALDYVVVKIPRFAFEKFSGSKDLLTTQMRSVGEVMALGRTFQEALMKAIGSLEAAPEAIADVVYTVEDLAYGNSKRLLALFQAFRNDKSVEEIAGLTQIEPWFLEQIQAIVKMEIQLKEAKGLDFNFLRKAKRLGFPDARIAKIRGLEEEEVFKLRQSLNLRPVFFQVDTCAGEFKSATPYFYSTYWSDYQEAFVFDSPVAIIGSGPNRIGQGIEFDYSCVRGVKAFQKLGKKVAMINSNPETVSTDYDTSDFLFFEPLTLEHVTNVLQLVHASGVVAQLGGQTPINLAWSLVDRGFAILGSSLDAIDLAEDRGQFSKICKELNILVPKAASVYTKESALKEARDIGFPLICRPSYVLGGRRMEVIEDEDELESYFDRHSYLFSEKRPCFMDQFLEGALEVDVDLACGPDWVVIGGVTEHIEAAGVHSGDSMGVLPPQRLKPATNKKIEDLARKLAQRMEIRGLLNLQLAVRSDVVYILEANPRSSRSVPFVSKATGIPLIDLGVAGMLNICANDLNLQDYQWLDIEGVFVKGVVFPFKKFPEADSILGPEMKSTGETMGRGATYAEALMKALLGSQVKLPLSGEIFFSLREKDKEEMLPLARSLAHSGYTLSATSGTATYLEENGIKVTTLKKVHEGRPHCVDRIRSGQVVLVVNTTSGRRSIEASFDIRRACIDYNIPCITESDAAEAFVLALKSARQGIFNVAAMPKTSDHSAARH